MQLDGSKYFGPQTLGSKIQLFLNIVMCISNLRESQMQQHCSKYFAHRPPPHRRAPDPMETKAQNSTFSEHGHVAYQTKGNLKFSNRIANILQTTLPPDPWGGIKILLFQNMVIRHIKIKGITNAATW